VQRCRDIPGKELFQYIDEEGKRQAIESGMVNDYIREISGDDFTAKDLRTWCGSLVAMRALNEAGPFSSEREAKRKVVEALDRVSVHLGNTRTVCRKYYVHPLLTSIYEKGEWDKCVAGCPEESENGLSKEELLLLKLIQQ
jgi:DNA topoisomerase-1